MLSLLNLLVQPVFNLNQSRIIALHPDNDHIFIGSVDPLTSAVSVFGTDLNDLHRLKPTLLAQFTIDSQTENQDLSRNADRFIISLKVLLESDQLCLVTADGQISLCPIPLLGKTREPLQFDGVGAFEDGILCASWSPDDELLVVITGSHKLILLTKSFDVLSEHEVDFAQFGSDEPVNVGWGAKSTQFHGSLGKAAAQAQSAIEEQETRPSRDLGNDFYEITWRGDGAFFAVACPANAQKSGQHRSIKVYSRTASLSSSSTRINPLLLHGPIAWRPEGSIIASSVYDPSTDKVDIIFFERNGLQRYGFSLKEEDRVQKVFALAWNSDSTVLAIGLEKKITDDTSSPVSTQRSVQLWTRNNYHWYLKSEVQSDLHPQGILNFIMWHPEKPLHLYLGTASHVELRQFSWEVFSDRTPIPRDTGSVAVIDGYQLLLSPFRYQVVPPPMSSLQIPTISPDLAKNSLPRLPSHMSFSATFPGFTTILPNGEVTFYRWDLACSQQTKSHARLPTPTKLFTFMLENATSNPITYRQVCISEAAPIDGLSCVIVFALFTEIEQTTMKAQDGLHIQKLSLPKQDYSDAEVHQVNKVGGQCTLRPSHPERWWKLSGSSVAEVALIQTDTGGVVKVSSKLAEPNMDFGSETTKHRFPEFCPTFDHLWADESHSAFLPIGLSHTAKLYVGSHMIANDCSSFTCDSNYLIYATFSHQIKFLDTLDLCPKSSNPSPYELTPTDPRQNSEVETILLKEASRAVERGSRIVTSIPSSMKLILQMPRGNLETIFPRPMVLRRICMDLLIEDRWLDAFIQCRKHKIDFNLLVDFDIQKFMNHGAKEFVEQVVDVDHINLFLSSLKNIDVTEQIYPITKRWRKANVDVSSENKKKLVGDNKVNAICTLIADAIGQKPNKLDYINSISTALVCKRPADYRSALNLLSEIKLENPEKVDDAIRYIIFLSDANELYKVALSMYDLSLVVLIAQHSQKDPKEYLPFLQSLRALDPEMRKFRIDDFLGNHRSAIKHLCAAQEENFDGILNYTERHALYEEALREVSTQPSKVTALRDLQGDWFMENQKYMEAALVYTLAEKIEKASEAFRQAEAWQELFSLLSICGRSVEMGSDGMNSDQNVLDMAQRLEKSGRHLESATVLFDYAGDVKGGVTMLCDGRAYSEALRQALRYSRPELLTQLVKPSAEEYVESLIEEIEETQQHMQKQVDRLAELKLAAEAEPDAFYLTREKETGEVFDGIDAMTEATTVFRTDYSRYTRGIAPSRHSTYTTRSGRSSARSGKLRKKEEKKKAAGKKGSIYEEEYLLNLLVKAVSEKLPSLQNQVRALLPALVQLMSFIQRNAPTSDDLAQTSSERIHSAARSLQSQLDNLQTELIKNIQTVWDVRESVIKELEDRQTEAHQAGTELVNPGTNHLLNDRIMVARPVIIDDRSWKYSIFN
ncbi:IKI3 family-domain-containing protein [Melampsora americana]|nr:IKI3 family-domain-containing protein [Melampsora americana]